MADARAYQPLHRDAVVVRGPDAVSYLQGQLSQDVATLEVGGSAWSWLLQPAGKVDALVRVTRTGPDSLLVDTDKGWGEAVLNRLNRFKLRTKADLQPCGLGLVAVRGTGAVEVATSLAADSDPGDGAADVTTTPAFEAPAIVVLALWAAGEEAADVLVRTSPATPRPGDEAQAGAAAEWDAARIAAGVPAMGAELTEKTIPAETGLVALTVSFTKGCYTGQELVARIDSRGSNVPRRLRGLRGDQLLEVGAELSVAGKVVGTVTSAAVSDATGPVALGYLSRSVAPGDDVAVGGGGATVEVVELSPAS